MPNPNQLPESARWAARNHLAASLRRQRQEKMKTIVMKVPESLYQLLAEWANDDGFESRQGFITSLLNRERGRRGEEAKAG